MVTKYDGQNKLRLHSKEVIVVDQHVKCSCDCRIKQEDCNAFQEYRKDQCGCICTNLDEKTKCIKGDRNRLWDPKLCKCRCRDVTECSSGFSFDHNKCSCARIPQRRRFAELGSDKERRFSPKDRYHTVEKDSILTVVPMERHAPCGL